MDYMYLFMLLIPMAAQIYISVTYGKYKKIKNSYDMTGYDVARKILDDNGLNDVYVVQTTGTLSDHYDPRRKTVRLSNEVYNGSSVASMAIAAHECGHAIQHKEGYIFLKIRSFLVPFTNFSTKIGYFVVVIGLIFNLLGVAKFGIYLLLVILLFQLVTLPVEFNASSRAKKQLNKLNIVTEDEDSGVKSMLLAAAFTYVASLVSTLLQILRLALIVFSRNDD